MNAPQFIDIETAIGRLVLGGIIPVLVHNHDNGLSALCCKETGSYICPAYRDGSSYKVKSDPISDAIDDPTPFKLSATIVTK